MFEIEKGIPIPEGSTRGPDRGKLRLTMEHMEVGDSIVVTGKHRQHYHAIAKRIGIGYKSKTIMKSQNGREYDQIRLWRVS
jgi:hypothetical protein